MATTTGNLGLTKSAGNEYAEIDTLNTNMDIIDTAVGELMGKEVTLPEDFENPLKYVGCERVTTETESGYTEEWTCGEGVKARRVTTESNGSYTEVYAFYEDGKVTARYTVVTTESDGVWHENVTKEADA